MNSRSRLRSSFLRLLPVLLLGCFGAERSAASWRTNFDPTQSVRFTQALPDTTTVFIGDTLELSVVAPEASTFEWFFNGKSLGQYHTSKIRIPSVSPSVSGVYSVQASAFMDIVFPATTSTTVVVASKDYNPVVAKEPQSLLVTLGDSAALSVTPDVAPPKGIWIGGFWYSTEITPHPRSTDFHYQWIRNGEAVDGATGSRLVLHHLGATNAGNYQCLITSTDGSILSAIGNISTTWNQQAGYLANLSIRSYTAPGEETLIAGVSVRGENGTENCPLLIRGNGPSLSSFGVENVISNPVLSLFDTSGAFVMKNQGWSTAANKDEIAASVAATGAYPISGDGRDSATLLKVSSGTYSAQVSDADGASGTALVEVYDATPVASRTQTSPRLINISGRGRCGGGSDALIAGFVIGGSTAKTVLIRGSGPALAAFGIEGRLHYVQLDLYNGDKQLLARNTGWNADPEITSAANTVGAFSWGTTATYDAAMLVSLPPGVYTTQVSNASTGTGVALVEVYEVP